MIEEGDHEAALEKCQAIEDAIEEILMFNTHSRDDMIDFLDSVGDKVADMRTWITDNEHVTQNQINALENMHDGVVAWQK